MKTALQPKRTGPLLLAILPVLGIILTLLYVGARMVLVIISDYQWTDKLVAWMLLFAEMFILFHGIGYLVHLLFVIRSRQSWSATDNVPPLKSTPPVAVVVASYKEPLDVVEDTLVCFYNLTYSNKRLYFLDDTRYDLPSSDPAAMQAYRAAIDALCRRLGVNLFRRKWHGAKAGIINDFMEFIDGKTREGFEFQSFTGQDRTEKEKYLVVFDADANPMPDFIRPLVAFMEANPKLAFVQTPQYYTNFETNRVAMASGLQQVVFYEYICEGKSAHGATFCCGTNVIFRREAFLDVGGFDETSVTEDFVTSMIFHRRGWESRYYNKVSAFNMGPEDLGAYFKQQFRWALGTIGLLRQLIALLVRHPRALSLAQWWEYLVSGSYYLIGTVFLIIVLCPVLYLFFTIPTYFSRPEVYALFFIPYFVLTLFIFFSSLSRRNYRIRDIFLGQLLVSITFPVYIKATLLGLLGIRGRFIVTPKGGGTSLPLRDLWPQLGVAALSFAAIVWGVQRMIYEPVPAAAMLINMFWCLYHFAILSSVLYFNQPEMKPDQRM